METEVSLSYSPKCDAGISCEPHELSQNLSIVEDTFKIFFFHLRTGFPSCVFYSRFPAKVFVYFSHLFCALYSPHVAHLYSFTELVLSIC